jgi:hypothetical protein
MGIKLFEFLRRTPGTTREQFFAHWHDVHAQLLATEPDLRRHVRRYELNLRLPGDADRPRNDGEVADTGWDGVAVLWFDSVDEMRALGAEPAMAAIRDDAPNFRVDERLIVVTEDPEIIVSTPRRDEGGAKMLCILRRNAALDLDTFHEHWSTNHGGLYRTVPELRDPLWGYEQNHGLRDPNAAFDGVTEQWFESLGSFVESLSAPANAELVNPDVAYLLDPTSINFIMAEKPTVVLA